MACSGGGVRSSAFCLGVFQALDSINPNNAEPQVLDAVDYLSTVSGGGYIATSVAAGLMQEQGRFPYESKLDDQETLETKHIRDHSNYLVPKGFFDILVGLSAVLRGLVVNAIIFLGIILWFAAGTVCHFPTEGALRKPHYFGWGAFLAILIISQIAYALLRPRKRSQMLTLTGREWAGWGFAVALSLCAIFTFFELQPYVLAGLFDARHLRLGVPNHQENQLGLILYGLPNFHTIWASLAAAATALIVFGNKLSVVATATRGDQTWGGFLKHWSSRFAIYAAAVVVPLLLWFIYLAFSYWGIGWENPSVLEPARPRAPAWLISLINDVPSQAHAWLISLINYVHSPAWLIDLLPSAWQQAVTCAFWPMGLAVSEIYFIAAIVLIVISLLITPNANSLHSYYRDRLSRAFLWDPDELKKAVTDSTLSRKDRLIRWGNARLEEITQPGAPVPKSDPDRFKLSSLKPRNDNDSDWSDDVRLAPYLLINTSVNLQGSDYLNKRGRNADSFFLSPLYVGSEATGYSPTSEIESTDPHVNLATAMAISRAAASPNMGASTIRALTFSLAALNVRLGYWFPNPGSKGVRGSLPWYWPIYFAMEAFGLLDEQTKKVYVTDGGGFDNLGIYELLRRRCKVIIAADAEADPPLNFDSLIRLQAYARIDLGVRIDLPWEDIRRSSAKITVECPHGSSGDPARRGGPHVAVGRIDYGKDDYGVLIYIKASLSGDESDLIRDYRRRHAAFPHEATLDQFFGEEQFEVYRALGFHATRKFFLGEDRAAMLKASPVKDWPEAIRRALIRLNIPASAVGIIVERQQDALARERGVSKV
ncbi:MAG: patatin-like phospholipase family protein [Methylocella sp.]